MKNRAAFEIQLASILEALTKAAMTEISKLVEDGAVALRLEVSQSHKEIDCLRRKLQQVENERRTTQETTTRESRSVGVQIVNQCDAAGGAVQGGAGAPFVEQLNEKRCKTETNGTKADFGFAVKEEQEDEHVAQILHQTESEHEQCSQSQPIFSPIQHTPATMEMCGSTLSTLGKDSHVVGDVKEEAAAVALVKRSG
ncbi:hypothetical protein GJAV_G00093710 [Gymnothorax javanicus]|nr:hypothetical protein GJAV_G00093710 [Gymnothorax javanicus]